MSTVMLGMRSKYSARVGLARLATVRCGFLSDDIDTDDANRYSWTQVRGPNNTTLETQVDGDWTTVVS